MEPAEFAREHHWEKEAETWQAVFDTWEQAKYDRTQKEREALGPIEPIQWMPPTSGAHNFPKEQGLGFDFSLLPELMAELAEAAGLFEDAETWKNTEEQEK